MFSPTNINAFSTQLQCFLKI